MEYSAVPSADHLLPITIFYRIFFVTEGTVGITHVRDI
jgi:hypothetical protein